MHKGVSQKTGGSNIAGWSTAPPTKPHDYRIDEKSKISRLGKNGSDKFINNIFLKKITKLLVSGQSIPDAPLTLPYQTRLAIKRAGGVVAWAIKHRIVREALLKEEANVSMTDKNIQLRERKTQL